MKWQDLFAGYFKLGSPQQVAGGALSLVALALYGLFGGFGTKPLLDGAPLAIVVFAIVAGALVFVNLVISKLGGTPLDSPHNGPEPVAPPQQSSSLEALDNVHGLDQNEPIHLGEHALVLLAIRVGDYGACASTLRAHPECFPNGSISLAGVYGTNDFMLEAICDRSSAATLPDRIAEILRPCAPEIHVESHSVARVAMYNGAPLEITAATPGIPVEDARLAHEATLHYRRPNNVTTNEPFEVPNLPFIVAFVWLEPDDGTLHGSQLDAQLNDLWMRLCQKTYPPLTGLYRLDRCILIKLVFNKEHYYSFTAFTRKIDYMLRETNANRSLRLRTEVAAEILLWK